MKKLLALIIVGAFAFPAFAEEAAIPAEAPDIEIEEVVTTVVESEEPDGDVIEEIDIESAEIEPAAE